MNFDLNLALIGQQVQSKVSQVEELLINPTAIPGLEAGKIIEIHNPGVDFPRLLLGVKPSSLRSDLRSDSINILHSIVDTFHLRDRLYHKVSVALVNQDSVTLDSVELYFTGQYLNRSDMWRLKTSLIGEVVYLKKVVYFCGHAVSCHVFQMWSNGERVSAGFVSSNTKVVFRSKTSMFHIYIQMSDEMWDYDVYGDLYFEKAVNGFLAQLFNNWLIHNTNHEVTITLFSRVFYKVKSIKDIPKYMIENIHTDTHNGFYEDFYRVVVQSERRDDWSPILEQIRRLFTGYRESLLHFQRGRAIANKWPLPPKAYLSSAASGNFLEVLNISMNVYEKHGLHRSLERTGQMCVVVSPGVGVFQVKREMNNLTKQRIIDYGVGIDLVCVGEQPLHAVPLLKFQTHTHSDVPDYYLPHTWINLSFYSSNKRVGYSNFVPRIKVSPLDCQPPSPPPLMTPARAAAPLSANHRLVPEPSIPNSLFDYDAYDDAVFTLPDLNADDSSTRGQRPTTMSLKRNRPRTRSSVSSRLPFRMSSSAVTSPVHHSFHSASDTLAHPDCTPTESTESSDQLKDLLQRIDIEHDKCRLSPPNLRSERAFGLSDTGRRRSGMSYDDNDVGRCRRITPPSLSSSACDLSLVQRGRPGRALFNPFDPRNIVVKHTSNRRRWSHIFPKGPGGVPFQQHHFAPPLQVDFNHSSLGTDSARAKAHLATAASPSLAFLWGAPSSHGEHEWSANVITGVDWKSLTMPACLPITTDYHPQSVMLDKDHLVHQYSVMADEDADSAVSSVGTGSLASASSGSSATVGTEFQQQQQQVAARRVFEEMVSQRLCQGFQLIVASPVLVPTANYVPIQSSKTPPPPPASNAANHYYLLSIGRIFHSVALVGTCIQVTHYRPRYPYRVREHVHRYWARCSHHTEYCSCRVLFNTDSPEDYNWNYLDNYICFKGGCDFPLTNGLKFWRCRLVLISQRGAGTGSCSSNSSAGSGSTDSSCKSRRLVEHKCAVDDFIRFISSSILAGRLKKLTTPWTHRERGATAGAVDRIRTRSGSSSTVVKARHESARSAVPAATTAAAAGSHSNEDVSRKQLCGESSTSSSTCLSVDSSLADLFAAMRAPDIGVLFVSRALQCGLPDMTFISVELVQWALHRVTGLPDAAAAIQFCERLRQRGLILHASGDRQHPFINGTYFYCLLDPALTYADISPSSASSADQFRAAWMQVETSVSWSQLGMSAGWSSETGRDSVNGSGSDNYQLEPADKEPVKRFRECSINLDISSISDRPEWGQLVYEHEFRPNRAYEMSIHWLVGSGGVLAELVGGWQRRAENCGFKLVQVPALVCSTDGLNADPFRVPVRVPINIDALQLSSRDNCGETGIIPSGVQLTRSSSSEEDPCDADIYTKIFREAKPPVFPSVLMTGPDANKRRRQLIQLLQWSILERLHMVRMLSSEPGLPMEFVHSSGHCFVQVSEARWSRKQHADSTISEHGDSIDTLVSAEFLWYNNYLVSRRWSPRGGNKSRHDEAASILNDLISFCQNSKGQLLRLWTEIVGNIDAVLSDDDDGSVPATAESSGT